MGTEVGSIRLQYINADEDEGRADLNKAQAHYTRWLKVEEALLRQRINVKLLEEGDSNSKYFHAVINERRRRLTLHKIKTQEGQWLHGDQEIATGAIEYFQALFR